MSNTISYTAVAAHSKATFVEHYIRWANNPEVTAYLFQGTFPVSEADAEAKFDSFCNENNVVFYILLDGKIVGICGIHDIFWPSQVGEFRVLIGETDAWGKGIGKHALKHITCLAFDKYNLHKIFLGVNVANERARKIYENCGYTMENSYKDHFYRDGEYHDIHFFSLFRKDYANWKTEQL